MFYEFILILNSSLGYLFETFFQVPEEDPGANPTIFKFTATTPAF
jgi:hypothetical protein